MFKKAINIFKVFDYILYTLKSSDITNLILVLRTITNVGNKDIRDINDYKVETVSYENAYIEIDETHISDEGIIIFNTKNTEEYYSITIVEKIDNQEIEKFPVLKGEKNVVVPLIDGNGDYQIIMAKKDNPENTSSVIFDIRYYNDLTIQNNSAVFTSPNYLIPYKSDNKAIKVANFLRDISVDDKDYIDKVSEYIKNTLEYDYEKRENVNLGIQTFFVSNTDESIETGKGTCTDYSTVFASMLRSQGIQCKMVFGWYGDKKEYHAWNEYCLNEEEGWVIVDLTYEDIGKEDMDYSLYRGIRIY